MRPAKVPQHLELDDVVAWSLGATDLLFVVAGAGIGWWLYLSLPGSVWLRVAAAAPIFAFGFVLGVVRVADRSLREWAAIGLAFIARPRLLVTGVGE